MKHSNQSTEDKIDITKQNILKDYNESKKVFPYSNYKKRGICLVDKKTMRKRYGAWSNFITSLGLPPIRVNEKITTNCGNCNICIYIKYYRYKNSKNKNFYCSKRCSAIVNNKKHIKRVKQIYYCECGKQKNDKKNKYCSDCYTKSFTDHSATKIKDVLYKRGTGKHAYITYNARRDYRKSNKPKLCVNCDYDKYYEVCHIKAVKNFSLDSTVAEVNDLNNLVALCRNCHWEFDHEKDTKERIINMLKTNCQLG